MSHECFYCGFLCACDIEDMEWEQPDDCIHILNPVQHCPAAEPDEEYEDDDFEVVGTSPVEEGAGNA